MNKAWKRKVGTTVEWSALEMVRVYSPGYMQFLAEHHEPRPSLRERVEDELSTFSVHLAEHLVDFRSESEVSWSETSSVRPVESKGNWKSSKVTPRVVDSYRDGRHSFPWESAGFRHDEQFVDRERNYFGLSEEEEMEAYASSVDSLMRVYYLRHSMRV